MVNTYVLNIFANGAYLSSRSHPPGVLLMRSDNTLVPSDNTFVYTIPKNIYLYRQSMNWSLIRYPVYYIHKYHNTHAYMLAMLFGNFQVCWRQMSTLDSPSLCLLSEDQHPFCKSDRLGQQLLICDLILDTISCLFFICFVYSAIYIYMYMIYWVPICIYIYV